MRWGGEAVGLGGKCYGPGSQSPQAACASLPGKEALMGSVGISVSRRGPGLGPWRWRARQRERGRLLDRGRWRRGDRRPRGAGGQGRTRPRLPGPALSCHGLWYAASGATLLLDFSLRWLVPCIGRQILNHWTTSAYIADRKSTRLNSSHQI